MNRLRVALSHGSLVAAFLVLGCEHGEGPAPILSPEACEEANGEIIGDPGDGSTLRDGCPAGRQLLGRVPLGIEGSICCERAPALSLAECAALGGYVISDPGDGSSYRDGCPNDETLLGTLGIELGDEGGICCSDD